MSESIIENLNKVNQRIDLAVQKIQELEQENQELKKQIEKMKSDFRNLDTSGTKEFVLERIWNLFEEWELAE